MSMIEKNVNMW